MKSQSAYEFYISFMIFVTTITFIFYQIISYHFSYSQELKKNVLYTEAYQISQILVNDYGEPENWNSNLATAKRIGLASQAFFKLNLISFSKARAASNLCNTDYNRFKKLIGTNYDLNLVLFLANGTYIINCTKPMKENFVRIARIVSFDDGKSYGELILWVY